MSKKPNVVLKTLLFEQRITQRALAFAIGVDEGLISKSIRYGIDTEEIREKIASFLDIEKSKLFREDKSQGIQGTALGNDMKGEMS